MKSGTCPFPNEQKNQSVRKQERSRIDAEIKSALNEFDGEPERQAAFENLLACVRSRTQLLKPTAVPGGAGWVGPVFLIKRLQNLAARQAQWLRSCETWQPVGGNLRPVFRSLASHLLTHYPVPGFMDCVWDLPSGPEGFRQQA